MKSLTLFKVLAVIAWADGEITNAEHNVLKRLYRHFGLTKPEIDEIQHYLRAPLPKKEQDSLFRDLAAEMGSKQKRKEALAILEEMAHADSKLTKEEHGLLWEYSQALQKSSVTRRSFGRVRSFLKRTLFKPAREKNPEKVQYFKSEIEHKVSVRLGKSFKPKPDKEEQWYLLCLLGILLAHIAFADGCVDEREKKILKKILSERYELQPNEWKALLAILEEQAEGGFDFDEVIREFNRVTTFNDRVLLMDCFFAMAVADGDMAHEEVEEIRRITKAMHIPHPLFIERKMAALEPLRRSKSTR